MRHVAITLLFGPAVFLAGCFNPPSDPVQFACDPDDAAECPAGYECRVDGCCHREDTPDDDQVGACKLGVGSASGTPPPSTSLPSTVSAASDSSSDASSSGGATDATSDTGTSDSTGATSTTAETADSGPTGTLGSSTDPQTTGST